MKTPEIVKLENYIYEYDLKSFVGERQEKPILVIADGEESKIESFIEMVLGLDEIADIIEYVDESESCECTDCGDVIIEGDYCRLTVEYGRDYRSCCQ